MTLTRRRHTLADHTRPTLPRPKGSPRELTEDVPDPKQHTRRDAEDQVFTREDFEAALQKVSHKEGSDDS